MNEQQFAAQVRLALEESTERLPYRVSYRLKSARTAALARLDESLATQTSSARVSSAGNGTLTLGGLPPNTRGLARWGWMALSTVSALVLAVGLFTIADWSEQDWADEAAEIDLAVLTDELPIAAYADRGFGVYLKNSQQ